MQLNSGLSTRALINANIEMKRRDDDNTTKAEWNCSLGLFCYIDVVARQFASGQASFNLKFKLEKRKEILLLLLTRRSRHGRRESYWHKATPCMISAGLNLNKKGQVLISLLSLPQCPTVSSWEIDECIFFFLHKTRRIRISNLMDRYKKGSRRAGHFILTLKPLKYTKICSQVRARWPSGWAQLLNFRRRI